MSGHFDQILVREHVVMEKFARSLPRKSQLRLSSLALQLRFFLIFVLSSNRIGIEVQFEWAELILDKGLLGESSNLLDFIKSLHHTSVRILNLVEAHLRWG